MGSVSCSSTTSGSSSSSSSSSKSDNRKGIYIMYKFVNERTQPRGRMGSSYLAKRCFAGVHDV